MHGSVAPGFEPVRDAFLDNFTRRGEIGAACAVYHRGEKVVDLWGGLRDPARQLPWEEDTLVVVFSTTKGVASTAVAHAHARGRFDYDAPMAEYWPEFAQHGKEAITVRTVLSHQAGLCAIDEPLDLDKLADPDVVAAAAAKQAPAWTPGDHHGYHALTLGWYDSELLRRTDPQSRTIGRYFADEIAPALGIEFYIGLPDTVDPDRIAVLQARAWALRMLVNMHKLPPAFVIGFLLPGSITSRAFGNPAVLGQPARYNGADLRALELPAANGIGQVRGIARAYGDLAVGGPTLGLDRPTLDALENPALEPRKGIYDLVVRCPMRYGLGYCKPSAGFDFGSPRAYGTPGAGGSFGFADPELELGFAYAMNRMDYYVFMDPREVALSDAAKACARRVG
ncbi:MAG: serine hydrolase domain-containing protein [Myxococcota bacterium]